MSLPFADWGAGNRQNHTVIGQQYRPFDYVFQFPDITGPVIGHQGIYGRGGNPADGDVM
jgi:hypothetical protein